nr:hypothetical protein Iba_chr05eCG7430 [Ipomoea batatas]
MEKGRGGGIRWSTPLLRRTRSVAAVARLRELADTPGEEVASREGRRRGLVGHCPTPPDLLASSEISSTASLRLFGCRSSAVFCSVLTSDLPITLFLFLPDTPNSIAKPYLVYLHAFAMRIGTTAPVGHAIDTANRSNCIPVKVKAISVRPISVRINFCVKVKTQDRQSEVESGLLGASYVVENCSAAAAPDPIRSPA